METISQAQPKNKWILLIVLALMPFMATMDGSVTSIALPVISQNMGINTEAAQMVQIVYLTVIAISTLLFGRLGDIHGKSRFFLLGAAFFTIGTTLSAASQSFGMLLAARVIQAVGASAALATNQGIVTEAFPSQWRGRALGIVGMAVALGAVAGPLLGGFLISTFDWHSIYMLNIPIGIVVFSLGLKALPRTPGVKSPLDVKGAVLIAVPVFLFFFVLLGGQRSGYNRPYIPIFLVIAASLFVWFIFAEKKAVVPLLDLRMFKNPLLSISLACMAIQFLAVSSTGVIQPYYMEDVLSMGAGQSGLIFAGLSITMAVVSPLSGWIADRRGPHIVTLVGISLTAASMFLLSTQATGTSVVLLVIFMAVLGAGAGLFNAPNNSIIMSTASRGDYGVVGSLTSFTRSFSNTTGTSMYTVMFYTLMSNSLGYKVNSFVSGQPQAFVDAMQGVYIISGCIVLLAVVLTAVRLFSKKHKLVPNK